MPAPYRNQHDPNVRLARHEKDIERLKRRAVPIVANTTSFAVRSIMDGPTIVGGVNNPTITAGTTQAAVLELSGLSALYPGSGIDFRPGLYVGKIVTLWTSDPTGMKVKLVHRSTSLVTIALGMGERGISFGGGNHDPINGPQEAGVDQTYGTDTISTEFEFQVTPYDHPPPGETVVYDSSTDLPKVTLGIDFENTSGNNLTLANPSPLGDYPVSNILVYSVGPNPVT